MEYVTCFEDIKRYCDNNHDQMLRVTGKPCEKCCNYKCCLSVTKEMRIASVLSMKKDDSRLPGWLFDFAVSNTCLLNAVPAIVYKKLYGMSPIYLPCPFNGERFLKNLNQYEKVYFLLKDEWSKLSYINVLMYRLTLNIEFLYRAYSMEPQYFINSFRGFDRNNTYVDCGAYVGDSFIEYCRYNSPPEDAFLFEPDQQNILKMKRNLIPYSQDSNIHYIEKGVYRNTGILYFASGKGVSSYLSDVPVKNGLRIDVVSIDDVIEDKIGFIKMDIEGSEKDAIIGAKEHIKNEYPKLAISIYHSIDDLWEIPLMIHDMFPNYTMFELRHHTKYFGDTVLYVSR